MNDVMSSCGVILRIEMTLDVIILVSAFSQCSLWDRRSSLNSVLSQFLLLCESMPYSTGIDDYSVWCWRSGWRVRSYPLWVTHSACFKWRPRISMLVHLRHVGTYTRLRERIHSLYSVNHWQSNDYEMWVFRCRLCSFSWWTSMHFQTWVSRNLRHGAVLICSWHTSYDGSKRSLSDIGWSCLNPYLRENSKQYVHHGQRERQEGHIVKHTPQR